MGTIYIENKSQNGEVLELIALDGIRVLAQMQPGQHIQVNSKPGTAITPFIVRPFDPNRK